ncbi:YtxH domain-containing protein [Gracilibacillus sp. S3-1-1]|uniref:YtxH domain-containing protein n=1 Tax=Gracilibacillus pellucidus TaxID=3095368 RepID=A0ACC6M7J9_9BACI|nr:YtxH domain-containing protein [Gracilibacillus sp. S3-1-1]MDX8046895.1 YtxH domain-containing protein [Gracilibacillus sp. S3-1-1]
MGRQKLVKGIIAGAIVGGLITLTDRQTRVYVKTRLKSCSSKASYYVKNPADAVHQLNDNYTKYSELVSSGLTSVLDTLHQLPDLSEKRDEDGKYTK